MHVRSSFENGSTDFADFLWCVFAINRTKFVQKFFLENPVQKSEIYVYIKKHVLSNCFIIV